MSVPLVGPRVDCHTHLGVAGVHVSQSVINDQSRVLGPPLWDVRPEDHLDAMRPVDFSVVLAFDAPDIGIVVPNEYVADYVATDDKLIGFASVDPKRSQAPSILEDAVNNLGLCGLKIGPAYQHFHPHSTASFDLIEAADSLRVPVIWHMGQTFVRDVSIEYTRPTLIDRIAGRFPDLRMWIAHMGAPWFDETMVTIRRHEHLFADTSAAHGRPLNFYFGMASAVDYQLTDRLLFGSDYPFASVKESVDGLRNVNQIVAGSALPQIPDDVIDDIIGRDTLALLGINSRPSSSGGT